MNLIKKLTKSLIKPLVKGLVRTGSAESVECVYLVDGLGNRLVDAHGNFLVASCKYPSPTNLWNDSDIWDDSATWED